MFDQLVESTAAKTKTNKPWTMAVSIVAQCAVVVGLVLVQIFFTQALPKGLVNTMLVAPPPPPSGPAPAPLRPASPPPSAPRPAAPHVVTPTQLEAPRAIPKQVQIITEKQPDLPPDPGATGGTGQGVFGGLGTGGNGNGGVFGGLGTSAAPPPPPPPAPVKPTGPSKVGGQVQAAKAISTPPPQYPPLARQARISGQVVLHAIIGKDGTVRQLEVVSGNPLLVQNAMETVKGWRYRPTLLNGEPVEVDTTVTVNFVLGS